MRNDCRGAKSGAKGQKPSTIQMTDQPQFVKNDITEMTNFIIDESWMVTHLGENSSGHVHPLEDVRDLPTCAENGALMAQTVDG